MEINIIFDNIDTNNQLAREINEYLKSIKNQQYFKKIDVDLYELENARHVIDVTISTNNENEYLKAKGVSCDFNTSLFDLKNKLKPIVDKYNPNQYLKQLSLAEKKQKEIELKKQQEIERINKIKEQKQIEIEKRLKKQEQEKDKKIKKHNKKLDQIAKKHQKEEERIEREIKEELDKKLSEINKLTSDDNQNLNEIITKINKSNEDISNDINEDNKVQSELKESKDKLRELWSEENECLVILDKMKEWNSKLFDDKYYKPNEPFSLVENKTIYHDGHDNFFILDNEQWVPYSKQDVEQDFEFFKANKLQQLENDLIVARAKKPKHILDLDDNRKVIEELYESKNRLKELSKKQKDDLKKYKKDGENLTRKIDFEMKNDLKNNESINNIDIIETHPANEQFVTDHGYYAYHDGEGHYFVYTNEEWTPVEKSFIYQSSKKITNINSNETHSPNETFLQNGVYYYYDNNNNYYKCVDNQWVASSYEECYSLNEDSKSKKKNKKNKEINNNQPSNSNNENQSQVQEQTQQQEQQTQKTTTQTTTSGSQQWQDENGYWWYLDENGNYYYADENGNWVPYQQS